MKCHNHPNAAAIENCARCEIALCGMCANFTATEVLCEPCVEIRENEKAVASQTQKLQQPDSSTMAQEYDATILEAAKRKSDNGPALQIGIIICCALIIVGRLIFFPSSRPNTTAVSSEDLAQLQTMTSLAQCMVLFQQIGQTLVAGEIPDPNTRCPDSVENLVIRQTADNIIVEHPSPELFGYSEISVSRLEPNPRVIQ